MSTTTPAPLGWTEDRLLALFPALWRIRDGAATGGGSAASAGDAPGGGGALAGMLTVIAEVADGLELQLDELRDDWFVETCADWVVPYVGDLVSAAPMHDAGGLVDLRAWVADTIALRRRKGTLAAIEATARAVTGYPVVAVEARRRLGWHQHLGHVRAERSGAVAVSGPTLEESGGAGMLDRVDGAFDGSPRAVDVRAIRSRDRWGPAGTDGDGHHNLPTVALFAWAVATERCEDAEPRPVTPVPDGRYVVHPLGLDRPLRRFARPETDVEHLAGEPDVPSVLRRRWLHDLLERRRAAAAAGDPSPDDVFDSDPPFTIRWRRSAGDPLATIPPERIVVCHLDDQAVPPPTGWRRPPTTLDTVPAGGGTPVAMPIDVGIDPATGRIAFPDGVTVDAVELDVAEPVVARVGASAAGRDDDLDGRLARRQVTWQVAVGAHETVDGVTSFATVADAVTAWHAQPAGTVGVITVVDGHRHPIDLTGADRIEVGPNARLLVVGARWPALPVPGGLPGETARRDGEVDAAGVRPALVGDIEVTGTTAGDEQRPGELVLHGLLLDGTVTVLDEITGDGGGDLGLLTVAHATTTGGVTVVGGNDRTTIEIVHTVTGPVTVPVPVRSVLAADSIIDAPGGTALDVPASAVTAERVTCVGRLTAELLEASDCLLTDVVLVARRQAGCVRHSWVAPGSTTPRRFRCQPDLALAPLLEEAASPAELDALTARLAPTFVSNVMGDPAHGLLLGGTADEVRRASSTGGEPGAHAHLHRPHREDNLRRALDEHLPLGLEAGLIDPGRHLP